MNWTLLRLLKAILQGILEVLEGLAAGTPHAERVAELQSQLDDAAKLAMSGGDDDASSA